MKQLICCLLLFFLIGSTASAESSLSPGIQTDRGFILDNVLHHPERGDIHFSLYVPDSYDSDRPVPLYIALPGWEGLYFQGVGYDLKWETLPFEARKLYPNMIIASAQLNDWGMTSALDTIALTEYLIEAYSIDTNHVYLSGLSGGGETGSLVMGLRPDLYAAYLMVASQWDGDLTALAAAKVPVYMAIGEDDSYYGSASLKSAYQILYDLYLEQGLFPETIDDLLVLDVKQQDWFVSYGYTDQHAGAVCLSYDEQMLTWFFSKRKGE